MWQRCPGMFFQQGAPGLRCCMTSPDPLPLIVLLFPREVGVGTIGLVSPGGDVFTIRLSGRKEPTSYALPPTVEWRDAYGTWYENTRPACMKPGTHGQQVTLGLVNTEPVADAPGRPVIVWLECSRKPVPRYPIVTPTASRRS